MSFYPFVTARNVNLVCGPMLWVRGALHWIGERAQALSSDLTDEQWELIGSSRMAIASS